MYPRKSVLPSMNALQCFEAVARHMSFTLAAQELCLTQGAVSKQIAQLEAILCQILFFRSSRSLTLTPAGKLYQVEVRHILNQVDVSARYVMGYGKAEEILTIAVQPTFGSHWLIPRLGAFMQQHPDIQLVTRSEARPFDLAQSRVDISIFFGHGSLPDAQCVRLFDAPIAVFCNPRYLASGRLKHVQELEHYTLIQCSSRPEIWRDWFAHQAHDSIRSYQGPRFETFAMCLSAAIEGLGIAAMPAMFANLAVAQGALVQPWSHVQPSDGAYYVACSNAHSKLAKIRGFVDWITQQAHAFEMNALASPHALALGSRS